MKSIYGKLFLLTLLLMIIVNACEPTGGTYAIKQTLCNQCMKCVPVCGYGAIKLVTTPTKDTLVIDPNKCIGCGECKVVCPVDAITSASAVSENEHDD